MVFKNGERIVVRYTHRYSNKYKGYAGTVRRSNYDGTGTVGVQLDGISNDRSQYGYFWFNTRELDKLSEERTENNMAIKETYTPVTIQFLSESSTCRYKYACYEPVSIGDICIVAPEHHCMNVACIVSIEEEVTGAPLAREVVAIVDLSARKARVARREKVSKLKEQMVERSKQLQDLALFKMLAEQDPQMATLLAEYEEAVK